ncbi:hypothetical protein M3Y94_01275600 [Aphelenchoides besseyi]|nr:hypothetical protein M3Y94_01275600 [Aphelenchoides besseyi]
MLICVFFLWSHVLADKPDCVRDDNGRNVSLVTGQCDEVKTSFIVKSKERELAFTITYSGYSIQGRQFILQMGTCKIEARIFKGGQNAAFLVLVDRSGQGPYYNLPIEGKVDENKLFFEGRYYGIDKKNLV